MNKHLPLPDAIGRFVRPGMHLNFGSTPFRSNASIRELARCFRGKRPEFVLSATGFHSLAHLLGRLRLGRKYVSCFFGDNYPVPRGNPLYQTLRDEGAQLEHWSLLTYVSALSAAAHGHPYALTRSLGGTDLAQGLKASGSLLEVDDPREPSRKLGLLTPLVPDIVFLHAAGGDSLGNAVFSPPHSEGFHGALAARLGVIVTVERLLGPEEVKAAPQLIPLPSQRVLAICEEPFGAHPQPLHFAPQAPVLPSYADDFGHYDAWRNMAVDDEAFARFEREVLDVPDGQQGYRQFVGPARLESLQRRASARGSAPSSTADVEPLQMAECAPGERLIVLAGRTIARRARQGGLSSILAGIGQSFAAARLAKLLLSEADDSVELMVETGFSGLDPGAAHDFLLAEQNIASAARLSSVDSVLAVSCCGGQNACVGVVGSVQVDEAGDVNSSFIGGKLWVGSGGAADIAAGAREVVVLAKAARERLVPKVEYVTSSGRGVRAVVTEDGVLERSEPGRPWRLRDIWPNPGALAAFRERCPWNYELDRPSLIAAAPTVLELSFLAELRRSGGAGRSRRTHHV